MSGSLDDLAEVLDRVAAEGLSDSESVLGLHRQLSRLEAIATDTVGRWDRQGEWAPDGARSAAAWLTARTRLPEGVARRRVRLGRSMKDLPADWADAKERLGRDPLVNELGRTPAQRRADALVEMAVRARTAPKDGRRPAPLFSVFVGFETFAGRICELAKGTVVTPGSLLPYLDEAYVERVVWESPSRVIDVGERRRFFAGATRRGVEVRDRECFHDTCDERERLQVDHIIPASEGGPTTQANGRLACGFHNRRRHRRPDAG